MAQRLWERMTRSWQARRGRLLQQREEAPGFGLEDIDPSELEEFLAADRDPPPIDPGFRDRLRERMWELLEEQRRAREGPKEASRSERR